MNKISFSLRSGMEPYSTAMKPAKSWVRSACKYSACMPCSVVTQYPILMEKARCQPSLSSLVQRRNHPVMTSMAYTLFLVSLMPSPVSSWNVDGISSQLYGACPIKEDAQYKTFTKNKKIINIMPLPPKNTNVMLQILCAYLQVMLWKSADKTSPPPESHDITQYGWSYKVGVPIPQIY